MTDPNHAEETVAPVPASSGAGPGVLIRRARERAMMSQDELAAQLRLSRATLDALEHDDFAALSEPVYVRGYYRKCAKFLHLSEAELLSAYDRVAVRRAPLAPTKLLLAGNSDGGRSGIDMRLVSWGVGIAVVVAIGVFALHKRGDLSATSVEQPTTTTGSAPVPATTPAAPAELPVSAVPSSPETAVPAAAPHAVLPSPPPAPVPTVASAHAAAAAAVSAASESPANSTAVHVLTSAPAPSQSAKTAPHVAALAPSPMVTGLPAPPAAAPHAVTSASTPALASSQAPKAAAHAAIVAVPAPMTAVTTSRVAAATPPPVAPELPAKAAAVIRVSAPASAPGSVPAAAPSQTVRATPPVQSQPDTSALEVRHHNAAPSGSDRNGATAVAVAAPPKPEVPKTETLSSATASRTPLPLEVSIHETSWVHIEDANGKLLLSRMMHPGDAQRVLGVAPYSVFVGYAPGVDLHYGDASVDLQPYSRDNSTARLKVPVEKFH
jgi:cytoskeleton protein RodZ